MEENKPQTEYHGFLAKLRENPTIQLVVSLATILALSYIISRTLPKSKEPDVLTKLASPGYSISEFIGFKGEANIEKIVKTYIKEKVNSNTSLEKIIDKG